MGRINSGKIFSIGQKVREISKQVSKHFVNKIRSPQKYAVFFDKMVF